MSGPTKLVRVPEDLAEVTHINSDLETSPTRLGMKADATQRIWGAVENWYSSGLHPGISLVLRRGGETLISRGIGHARGNAPDDPFDAPKEPMTADTPVCLFSASKAITAMLVHLAAEQGLLELDDLVTDYVPEYGVNGKANTTIRHLLAHRAGIPRIPSDQVDVSLLWDWDRAIATLCAAEPLHGSGKQQAYHAITAGFILGEILRRATGKELRTLLQQNFAKPLGARHFSYGVAKRAVADIAQNAVTGPPLPCPMAYMLKRVLSVPFEEVTEISNDVRFANAVIPAGNIYASAEDACRFFEMMRLGGQWQGKQILARQTIEDAIAPYGRIRIDGTLLLPMKYSAGMMLGQNPVSLYGVNAPEAYGHLGFLAIVCWADPARDLSGALLTTGKTMATPGLVGLAKTLVTISRQCPPINRQSSRLGRLKSRLSAVSPLR